MPNSFTAIATALVAAAALGTAAAAQQPRVENGAVAVQTASSPLASTFRALVSAQAEAAWIGYAVQVADRDRVMCCFNSGTTFVNGVVSGNETCCGACTLEGSSGTNISSRTEGASPTGPVKLEAGDQMVVLFLVLIIIVVPVQEHDNVRILLNGAGFSQI